MDDVEALTTIVALLKQLEPDAQRRVLHSVQTFLGISGADRQSSVEKSNLSTKLSTSHSPTDFSSDRTLSAKEFLRDKRPVTDVDRVTALAYYLTHYRNTPHFKTVDISALNTDSAQPKFSNASVSVENAARLGYLVTATKGNKQISAAGERFIELLPDREAARAALHSIRPRRNSKRLKST